MPVGPHVARAPRMVRRHGWGLQLPPCFPEPWRRPSTPMPTPLTRVAACWGLAPLTRWSLWRDSWPSCWRRWLPSKRVARRGVLVRGAAPLPWPPTWPWLAPPPTPTCTCSCTCRRGDRGTTQRCSLTAAPRPSRWRRQSWLPDGSVGGSCKWSALCTVPLPCGRTWHLRCLPLQCPRVTKSCSPQVVQQGGLQGCPGPPCSPAPTLKWERMS